MLASTSDAGATWVYHNNPLAGYDQTLWSVSCPGANTCYSVGTTYNSNGNPSGGTIVTTKDGGATWSGQKSDGATAADGLYSIACPGAASCFAVGNGGAVYHTSDGATWSGQQAGSNNLWGVACATGTTTCFAVGDYGTILKTTDGATWSPQTSNTGNWLEGVACPGPTTCYAAGNNGIILKTTDGATWAAQTSNSNQPLYTVRCTSLTACYAVGVAGTILETTDGSTWSQLTNPLSGPASALNTGPENQVFDLTCSTGGNCFAVTWDGNVLTPAASPTNTSFSITTATAGWYLVGGSSVTKWPDATSAWSYDASHAQWSVPSGSSTLGAGAWEFLSGTFATSHAVSVQSCSVAISVVPHRWNMVGNPCNRTVFLPPGARALLYNPLAQAYTLTTFIPQGMGAWVMPAGNSLNL
jgi:photosystem II stability/assembly factor-like uncharacterized protein